MCLRNSECPRNGALQSCAIFGSAVPGDVEYSEDIQPSIYRAPEAILGAPWSYSADIWNVGCMVRQQSLTVPYHGF